MALESGANPYQEHPEVMRVALADPTINTAEHETYFPALTTLLPNPGLPFSGNRVRRVMDFGCGPGNFTAELANMYRRATIVGVDAVKAMLPTGPTANNLSFRQWNGLTSLDEEPFDLVVSKMALHYLSPDELARVIPNLASLLTERGVFLISVPHSDDSKKFTSEEAASNSTAQIKRNIGQTGIVGTMWHRNHWLASVLRLMPENYVAIRDEQADINGDAKRLNFLLCPRGERVVVAFRKLRRLGLTRTPPRIAAEVTTMLSDDLRSVADYYASQGEI